MVTQPSFFLDAICSVLILFPSSSCYQNIIFHPMNINHYIIRSKRSFSSFFSNHQFPPNKHYIRITKLDPSSSFPPCLQIIIFHPINIKHYKIRQAPSVLMQKWFWRFGYIYVQNFFVITAFNIPLAYTMKKSVTKA